MMTTSPANCADSLAVTSVSDYDGLPGGFGTPENETDYDDTFTDFSNYGSESTAARTIAGPGEATSARCFMSLTSSLCPDWQGAIDQAVSTDLQDCH